MLGEMKDPSSVGPLLESLDFGAFESEDKAANKEIVTALGLIGDKKAVPDLVKLLSVRDNYTVIAACEALGALKATEAYDALNKLASEDSTEPFFSKKAIQALREIADPRAVPTLIRMMMKERKGVSFYVESSYALYQIGPAAVSAWSVLSRRRRAASFAGHAPVGQGGVTGGKAILPACRRHRSCARGGGRESRLSQSGLRETSRHDDDTSISEYSVSTRRLPGGSVGA